MTSKSSIKISLGMIALISSILSILGFFFFISKQSVLVAMLFAIISLITSLIFSIIAIIKSKNRIIGIIGLVISSISFILLSILITIVYSQVGISGFSDGLYYERCLYNLGCSPDDFYYHRWTSGGGCHGIDKNGNRIEDNPSMTMSEAANMICAS